MAYDEALAERVRATLAERVRTTLARRVRATAAAQDGIEERRMFGGLAFLLNGHMCCGVLEDRLVLRLGDDGARDALEREHVAPMDFTGRPLRSMVYVSAAGVAADPDLRRWIDRALRFTAAIPPKPPRQNHSAGRRS